MQCKPWMNTLTIMSVMNKCFTGMQCKLMCTQVTMIGCNISNPLTALWFKRSAFKHVPKSINIVTSLESFRVVLGRGLLLTPHPYLATPL